MWYLLIYLIFMPFLIVGAPLRGRRRGRILVIHTGKIGDYVNASVLFNQNACDVLIDRVNHAFATRDSRIKNIFTINEFSGSLGKKLQLALLLYLNNYDCVYITTPNALNLFIGLFSRAANTTALVSGFSGRTVRLLASLCKKKVQHDDNQLMRDSYLSMLDHAPTRVENKIIDRIEPTHIHSAIVHCARPRVGIAICSGNRSKSIPEDEWAWLFSQATASGFDLFIFGTESDQVCLEQVVQLGSWDATRMKSLLAAIPLKHLPDNLGAMDLVIGADTGPCYIADSLGVPVLVYAGPVTMREQRPMGAHSLIVFPHVTVKEPIYIFKTPYDRDWRELYQTSPDQREMIRGYIQSIAAMKPRSRP